MNEVLLLTHPQKYITELLRIISRFSKRIMGLFELIVEVHCVSWNSYYNFYRFLVRITALTKYVNVIFLFVNEKKFSSRLSHSTHSKKVSEVCIVFTLIEIEVSPFSFDLNKLLYQKTKDETFFRSSFPVSISFAFLKDIGSSLRQVASLGISNMLHEWCCVNHLLINPDKSIWSPSCSVTSP